MICLETSQAETSKLHRRKGKGLHPLPLCWRIISVPVQTRSAELFIQLSIKHLTHAFTSPRWKCTFAHSKKKKNKGKGDTWEFLRKQQRPRQNKCNARWLTWDLNWGLWLSLNYRWMLRVDQREVYVLLFPSGVVVYLLVTDASAWNIPGKPWSLF